MSIKSSDRSMKAIIKLWSNNDKKNKQTRNRTLSILNWNRPLYKLKGADDANNRWTYNTAIILFLYCNLYYLRGKYYCYITFFVARQGWVPDKSGSSHGFFPTPHHWWIFSLTVTRYCSLEFKESNGDFLI